MILNPDHHMARKYITTYLGAIPASHWPLRSKLNHEISLKMIKSMFKLEPTFLNLLLGMSFSGCQATNWCDKNITY